MSLHKVTATELRLRNSPSTENKRNIIALLPNGQVVEKLSDAGNGWWEVSTLLAGVAQARGYVASKHLEDIAPPPPPPPPVQTNIRAVHLTENRADITRSKISGRAYPLGESGRPSRNIGSEALAISSIHNIIDWLNVEQSARYTPTSSSTYCNIYAHDYCYLSGVYLPRVWWMERSIIELAAGRNVVVQYGQTVHELNANNLLRWLLEWGDDFGWRRVIGMDELQAEANKGKVCIISARNVRENSSGHIVAVVPENATRKAARNTDGSVRIPLQSQAGRVNRKYFSTSLWWLTQTFVDFGYFVHD